MNPGEKKMIIRRGRTRKKPINEESINLKKKERKKKAKSISEKPNLRPDRTMSEARLGFMIMKTNKLQFYKPF